MASRGYTIALDDFVYNHELEPLIALAGHQAGINICYEDAYGNEVARGLPEAAFLVNASNDAWFGRSSAPLQHLHLSADLAAPPKPQLRRNRLQTFTTRDGTDFDVQHPLSKAALAELAGRLRAMD